MRQLLLFLLLPFFLVMYSSNEEHSIEVLLYEEEPTDEDIEPEGKRNLSLPVLCYIDPQRGLVLANYNGGIIGYVIEDAQTGSSIMSFYEECDFIDFILSYNGEIRIRILTEFYPLIGYLNLNNNKL